MNILSVEAMAVGRNLRSILGVISLVRNSC